MFIFYIMDGGHLSLSTKIIVEQPIELFLFSVEKFIRNKILNSVVGVLLFFLKLPVTRKVKVCRVVGVLYKTFVGCHVDIALSTIFLTSSRYSLIRSYFLTAKIRVFSTKKSKFSVSGLFFSKTTPFLS